MKKSLLVVTGIIMAFACSMTAFAAASSASYDLTAAGSKTQDVTLATEDNNGNDLDDDDIAKTYSVNIAFDSLGFTYTFDADKTELVWNPEQHCYTDSTGTPFSGAWDNDSQDIVVTNHSNAEVAISASFAGSVKTKTSNGVTATLSDSDTDLASAVGTEVASAPSVTYTVGVSGQPTVLTAFTVDTVTVTFATK